jgi:hypothetical protein
MVHHHEHLAFHFHLRLLTATFQSRDVTRELPNNYPFIVPRGYIIDTVSTWDDLAKTIWGNEFCESNIIAGDLLGKTAYVTGRNVVIMHLGQRAEETSSSFWNSRKSRLHDTPTT